MNEQHPEPIKEPQMPESNTTTAGERIRALRKARKMTQSDLSAATGINIRQIQRVENGESAPRKPHREKPACTRRRARR